MMIYAPKNHGFFGDPINHIDFAEVNPAKSDAGLPARPRRAVWHNSVSRIISSLEVIFMMIYAPKKSWIFRGPHKSYRFCRSESGKIRRRIAGAAQKGRMA